MAILINYNTLGFFFDNKEVNTLGFGLVQLGPDKESLNCG